MKSDIDIRNSHCPCIVIGAHPIYCILSNSLFYTQASEDIVEQLPITYNNDELKTQTSKIILRYPLSSSGVPRARHLGQKYSSKRYTIEQRKRNIRNTLPVVKAKNTSYESIQIAVRFFDLY